MHTKELFLSLLIAVAASPAIAELPFEPVHASQQQELTSHSLQEEFDQFRAFSQGLTAETEYKVAQRKFVQAKRALDRAQRLLSFGVISEIKFAVVYYEYRQIETEMIRLPVEIVKAKRTAEFHKWRILEEGNPGTHHEPELVETMIEGIDSELQTLSTSLELAKVASQLAERYWENGQVLAKKNVIPVEQQELREMAYQNAVTQMRGIEHQIDLVKIARVSLQNSQTRLRAQN